MTGIVLCLTNPRARLSRSEERGHLFSALGELLWYLAETDALASIECYIPAYATSSDDGKTIYGAYGPRLFAKRGIDPLATATRLLRRRNDSRRAVAQLLEAEGGSGLGYARLLLLDQPSEAQHRERREDPP